MPDHLVITLLGAPQIVHNGRSLQFRSVKAVALLAYLATTGMQHERAELAAMLWPESDDKRARGALRFTLSLIKKELGDSFLLVTRRQIGMNPNADWEADVVVLQQQMESSVLQQGEVAKVEGVITLYQAEFLQGFSLPDSELFNEWIVRQRDALQRNFVVALKRLIAHQQAEGSWDRAISTAHLWLDLDPLHEPAHARLMQLYADIGNWTAVHDQYVALTDLLQAELGVLPQPETAALYQTLRQQRETAVDQRPTLATLSPEQRSRRVLIEKVRRFWVDGFLSPLHEQNSFIDLKLRFVNKAIAHPWEDVLDKRQTPEAKTILQAFRHADRALLILGEAGAGKTISLVSLANPLLLAAVEDDALPVPVILNLSGWAEREQTIEQWAIEEMVAKYQIPRRMGRAWVAEERLLLLLDGLDEMPPESRITCISAINRYRQAHGLTDLVVCCRQAAYKTAVSQHNVRLRLNGAIEIRPLTTAQIRRHAPPALVDPIFADEVLLEMAQSPLSLSMMQTAMNGQNASSHDLPPTLTHKTLFAQYAQQMVRRQKAKGTVAFEQAELFIFLSWLAKQMRRHSQAIFLVEQLQPSWLDKHFPAPEEPIHQRGTITQWLYLMLTRMLLSAFVGTPVMWSFVQLIRINPPFIEVQFLLRLANAFGITAVPFDTLFALLLINLLGGVVTGLLDALFFVSRTDETAAQIYRRRGLLQLLTVCTAAGAIMTLLISQTDPLPLALFLGGMEMLGIGVVFGYVSHGQSFRTEVRVRGALKWSWRQATLWGLVGATMSLLWSAIIWINDPAAVAWQLNLLNNSLMLALLGGVSGKQPSNQSRPNEGMLVAAQNGVLAFLLVAVPVVMLTAVTVNVQSGLYTGLMIGLAAGTAYGFNDLAKHLIIRLLLLDQPTSATCCRSHT